MSKHLDPSIRVPIDADNVAIQRVESLCIQCGDCAATCRDYMGILGTYDLKKTGDRAICVNCGQCAITCPNLSIIERSEVKAVKQAIADPNKIVVVSTSPSVRASLGEEFGMPHGSWVEGKMVELCRQLGMDYVLNTNYGADITIMEEAAELVDRIVQKKVLPQFTSCCPAWVKFVETYHPEMIPHLSTSKSPIGMQSATIKTYWAKRMNIDPERIVNVFLTPCTAKKMEIRRDEFHMAADYLGIEGMRDGDLVITTREIARWAKDVGIDFANLEDSEFDPYMGEESGGGIIFGNSGGVMEAALRSAYKIVTGEHPPHALLDFEEVRGIHPDVKEAKATIHDLELNVAVVYGLHAARRVLEAIESGEKNYHFLEVMNCPGGCIGGGGQPKHLNEDQDLARAARIQSLYEADARKRESCSYENAEMHVLYDEYMGKPLGDVAQQLLHTYYYSRAHDLDVSLPPIDSTKPQVERELVLEMDSIFRIQLPKSNTSK